MLPILAPAGSPSAPTQCNHLGAQTGPFLLMSRRDNPIRLKQKAWQQRVRSAEATGKGQAQSAGDTGVSREQRPAASGSDLEGVYERWPCQSIEEMRFVAEMSVRDQMARPTLV